LYNNLDLQKYILHPEPNMYFCGYLFVTSDITIAHSGIMSYSDERIIVANYTWMHQGNSYI